MLTKRKLPKRIQTYLNIQLASCKPSTVKSYRINLAHFCDYLEQTFPSRKISAKLISGLNRNHLQNYCAYLNRKNLVPYSKVNYLLSVKKYLQWEVDRGTLNGKILEVLDRKYLPKVPQYLPRPLSLEIDRLLQARLHQSSDPYAPLFLLLRHTGLRISELINLPKNCVLTTAKGEKFLKVPLGKMNTERLVPLTQKSLNLIENIRNLSQTPGEKLLSLSTSKKNLHGHLSRRFKKLVHDLDEDKPITFHRLRHTYATSLLTGGVGLVSLMKLLGHKRIEMTLRYAEVTPSHLRNEYFKAIRVIENQTGLAASDSPANSDLSLHPSEIFKHLRAFLSTVDSLPPRQKKNLLKKLTRLTRELSQIHFPRKFKIPLNRDN